LTIISKRTAKTINKHRETFGKHERLCSRKVISGLFENGNSFYSPFFRVLWKPAGSDSGSPAQLMISVAKRSFRLAVTRNLIKRRIREIYRRKKEFLYETLRSKNMQIALILIYTHDTVAEYRELEEQVESVLNKLIRELNKAESKC
jgi:ribonuclease P protein component